MHAFGAPIHGPHAYAGATKPLIRAAKADPEIHGTDGLGGVEGLPEFSDPFVQARIPLNKNTRAIEAMAAAIQKTWNEGRGQRTTLVTTGPQTNLALFLSVYPELEPAIEEIVFMGGGVGLGNRSAVAGRTSFCPWGWKTDCISQNTIFCVTVSLVSVNFCCRYCNLTQSSS